MSRKLLLALVCSFVVARLAEAALLVPTESSWKYLKGTVEASSPVSAWRAVGFDDSAWPSGNAPFSYGEGLPGTTLSDMQGSYSCIFMRKAFQVSNPASVAELRLNVLIDDGFIVWINGTEVGRYNMAAGEPARTTVATNAVEPTVVSPTVEVTGLLQAGENVLAIQGFNSSLAGSSDFAVDGSLSSHTAEATPPAIISVSPAAGIVGALSQITVTFDEAVNGVRADDLLINGFPAATAVSGQNEQYTFTFPQPPYGFLQITWRDQHAIMDYAQQPNRFDHTAPSATWQYELRDTTAPTIATLFPPAGATVRRLAQVELTFSEDVSGVDAEDLLMNGLAATNLTKSGEGPYVFQFPAPAEGTVNVSWAPSPGIVDLAATPNPFLPVNWSYTLDPNAETGDLVITEIMAENETLLADEDGEAQDWIEIYNRGTNTVQLAGWSLSDDPDEPSRWVFAGRSLAPGEYMVVFASAKDRRNPAATNRFHTNFRLTRDGEFLGLYSPDSPRTLVSGFADGYPEQTIDYSYGYDADGNLRYFSNPTPGAPNGASTIISKCEPVHFSVERGFYSNVFELHLSTPTLASVIRYTTDTFPPTETHGIVYNGPILVTNTVTVRAAAFRPNFLPSAVKTHSYLFNFSAARRALPVFNLVMPLTNWYGRSGILGIAGGSRASDGLYITNNAATDYHNPSQHGRAWERPVSVEYIKPEDNSGFQIDCGIRVQGSDWQRPRTTLDSKFSYRLYFRGDYGPGKLEYPVFPLSTAQEFDQLVLRAGFNEQVNPFIRDEIIRRMSQDMGQVASVGGLALVLRNGGIYTNNTGLLPAYNPCERVTSSMLQSKFGGGDEWDVIAPSFAISAEGVGVVDGDRVDFSRMMTNVWSPQNALRPVTNDLKYDEMSRRVDLPNFVDYCMLNAYTAMGDWPANNWRAARERSTNGIWRFFVWDAEWGMGIYALAVTRDSFAFQGTGTEDAGLNSTVNSEIARLYQGLRGHPEFRLLWADRIHKHFFNGGALTGLQISNRFNELRAELEPSFSPAAAMDIEILQWVRDRFPIIMGQFNTYGLYGYSNSLYGVYASSNAPVFNQHGGRVPAGFNLTMTAPLGGTIYYTTNGADPRVRFTGAVSNAASTYIDPVSLGQTMVVKARTLLNGTNWSALAEAEFKIESLVPTLRISEIMYNPIGGSAFEFLEIENYGATPVNLSGMVFDGITFTFSDGTILAGGARLVLASDANPGAFATRYPDVSVAGYFAGQLNNAGEEITLFDRAGNIVLSVSYDDEGLWPAGADGAGFSLVLANAGDPDDALNWVVSPDQDGSPGQGDTFPAIPESVVISEVGAASTPQWVELHNTTAGSINLAGYSLTDDSQARKFVLPAQSLAAGGYLQVMTTNAFVLSARGDEVLLYDPQTNLISKVSFGLQAAGYTLSRIGNDWTLGNPTPNAANMAAALGSGSGLVINEWLADALSGEDDWVELWNNSAQPVALQGSYLGVSNALSRINSRSFIGPYGFAQLFADEDPGPDHLDFRLPAEGGRIVVYDSTGAQVNAVNYGTQSENISEGRLPDGAATLQSFAGSMSPGASNYVISYTGPYLNEVMARNASAFTNSLGRVADWIEIHNPTAGAVDLAGMSLSVDGPEPFQWVFPANSVIAPSGYLVIWCDGDLPASTSITATLNCGQSLNGDSGGVYLFSAAGQLVNFIEYGFQLQNQSVGRVGAQWRLLQSPTPSAANATAATLGNVNSVTFNEWMADPVSGDDWFELYNAATAPVDIGGLGLTDDPSLAGQDRFRIAPLSFIAAKGWVRFVADGEPSRGFDHVNFSLNGGGETLRLYNTATFAPITSLYFGQQALGVSEGRLPDGAAAIASFPGSATPGDSNHQLPGNVLINEVLATTDQVELYNPSSEVANIGGWYLSNSRLDYKLYRIPDGSSVPAGGYLVVTPTGFDFNQTTGGEVILAVADAAGDLNGQRVHAEFGPQATGVSFGRFATSQGIEFVALATPTLGSDNAAALVGPIVINEIMYNPPIVGIEYVELHNISGNAQSISGWTIGNAVNVPLPSTTIPAGGFLFVEIRPEHGRLDNDGERIDLIKPGAILVDSVAYRDSDPWPSGPVDGEGFSLQRRNSAQFGNDPLNWLAAEPTPEEANASGDLPVINVAPQSLTVRADGSVTFSVDASGGAPLEFQWRFNGVPIPDATAPELTLAFVQVDHTGTYDVMVSNPSGTTLSPAAALFVQAPPVINVPPVSQVIRTNNSATFSVVARASAPVSYQWSFNGSPIPGATTPSYTVTGANLEHVGEYSVFVSNPYGNATAAANLIVLVPPTITLQPLTNYVVVGDDAIFRTAVTGLEPMFFRWRRPGVVRITNGIGFDSPILTLTNVPLTYSNNFIDLVVTNLAGSAQSRQVRLYVYGDTDDDKLPNVWEAQHGLNVNDPSDGTADKDGDGMNNRQEFLAGTDPSDPASFLRINIVNADLSLPAVQLSFNAVSNKNYTIQYRDSLSGPEWSKLFDVEGVTTNRFLEVIDSSPNAPSRFYKLLTPAER